MQVLYVVALEVIASDPTEDVGQACLDHLARWLVGPDDGPAGSEFLRSDGEQELSPGARGNRRVASWSYIPGEGGWAVRVEVRDQPQKDSDPVFVTRVTVGQAADGVRVRVSLARESSGTGLTPPAPAQVHQPQYVDSLVRDHRLVVSVNGQPQNRQYDQVRTPQQVAVLADALAHENRLPVVLLHIRTQQAHDAVRYATPRLVGMAAVVTLDLNASRLLNRLDQRLEIPYQGGLLVWPSPSAPPTLISPHILNADGHQELRAQLMSRIAPISVLARGTDEVWRSAQLGERARQARAAAAKTTAAVESGDDAEQIAALREELEQAQRGEQEALDAFYRADDEQKAVATDLSTIRAKYEQLEAENEQLKVVLQWMPPADFVPTLENVPEGLLSADVESLQRITAHLEQAADGRIEFTEDSFAAWKKVGGYPTPEEMRKALVTLTAVAKELYDPERDPAGMGYPDDWIKQHHGLNVSLQDGNLPKSWAQYDWDGRKLNATPHVKVNDGVPPGACGRIYFAFDGHSKKLVVVHVGLHA